MRIEFELTYLFDLVQRKQREVAKENEFYYELLVQSLPLELQEAYHLRNSTSQVTTSIKKKNWKIFLKKSKKIKKMVNSNWTIDVFV